MATRRSNNEGSDATKALIKEALDNALLQADSDFSQSVEPAYDLSERLLAALDVISINSKKAAGAFNNIVTCLAIKVALPNVDVRFHQSQIQDQTDRPAGFNFRGISENVVYPWLDENNFEGARSGWQTRTLERPKAYTLDYPENIQHVKEPFLIVFDEVEVHGQNAENALTYLMYEQLVRRETNRITLSIPRTSDIQLIVKTFSDHFFYSYTGSKGGSRLPVLAIYAIYMVMMEQVSRFQGMTLKPLEEHSAADAQTGALGDIEVARADTGEIFEAIEVKHNIQLSALMIRDAATKIVDHSVDRYYILTTHQNCEPSPELNEQINRVKQLYNCQLIGNGVIPSIKYYLRMMSDPSAVFPAYVGLLSQDSAVSHEHRSAWNTLVTQGV